MTIQQAIRQAVHVNREERGDAQASPSPRNLALWLLSAMSDAAVDPRSGVAAVSERTMPARRTICRFNEWTDSVPIIMEGWAASAATLPDGRRQILAFLLPGDLATTAALFEERLGSSVEAITDVRYLVVRRDKIRALMLANSELFDRITAAWVEERKNADQLLVDLGRRGVNERMARLILTLMKRLQERGMAQGSTFEFPLRQRHIADAVGLTPVHVSKVMGEFRRRGLIDIAGRTLTILNEKELQRMSMMR